MKKTRQYLKVTKLITAAMLLTASSQSYAQHFVPPLNPDIMLGSGAPMGLYAGTTMMESAMISVPAGASYNRLFAVGYYNYAQGGSIYLGDDPTTFGMQFFIPVVRQDVALGTDPTSTSTYWLATAGVDASGGGNRIDCYPINYSGGTFAPSTTPSSTLTMPVYTFPPYTNYLVRIDAIAEESNPDPWGIPRVSNFVVAWMAGNEIVVDEQPFNVGSTSITGTTITSGANASAYLDVAGIQRWIGGTPHDIALVTYLDNNNDLKYVEYDFTGPSTLPVSVTPVASGSAGGGLGTIGWPRIAAVDLHSLNGFSGCADYKIAATVDLGGGLDEIRTWDDIGGNWASSSVVNSMTLTPPYQSVSGYYNHYCPAVATRATIGGPMKHFDVSHYTTVKNFGGSYEEDVFMEPIDCDHPTGIANNPSTGFQDFYAVNLITGNVNSGGDPIAQAMTGACNTFDFFTFNAWTVYNSMSTYELRYKISNPMVIPSYEYKGSSAAPTQALAGKLQVYPNPASDKLVISGSNGKDCATRYEITDIIGRSVQSGPLKSENENTIQINGLIPGAYILNVYNKDVRGDHMRFIKN